MNPIIIRPAKAGFVSLIEAQTQHTLHDLILINLDIDAQQCENENMVRQIENIIHGTRA